MKSVSTDLWSRPFEVRLLMVLASDSLLPDMVTRLGSLRTCAVKSELNLSLVESELTFGIGTKDSFKVFQRFLSSLGRAE